MQSMADDEEIDTIELSFDTDLMTAESIQTGCSDTRATQKTSVEFLDFNDSNYVMPTVVGEVSTFSMGSAASHSNSSAAAASKPNSSLAVINFPIHWKSKSTTTTWIRTGSRWRTTTATWPSLASVLHDMHSFAGDCGHRGESICGTGSRSNWHVSEDLQFGFT